MSFLKITSPELQSFRPKSERATVDDSKYEERALLGSRLKPRECPSIDRAKIALPQLR